MTRTSTPEVTRAVAEFATGEMSSIPPETTEAVKRTLVDTVGVAVAGAREPTVRIVARTLGRLPTGSSTVWASAEKTDAPTAALLNGTAGHALDFDDVIDVTRGHPSVVLWPALLAVAEQDGCSGLRLVEAYLVGLGVQAALAEAMDMGRHYGRGWHSTSTIGVVGAAAATSRLLGMDAARTQAALGLAASMAGGSRQNFGTMTKPLHPGMAARDAVWSATLARNGFTADVGQLEGPLGYFALFAPGADLEVVIRSLGSPDPGLVKAIGVKNYPCCYETHRAADATLALRAQEGLDPADVESVRVTLQPGGANALIHHRPTSGLEAKFSAEYVVAAGLLDGRVNLTSFDDDQVRRASVQSLLRKVECESSPVPPLGPREWQDAYAVVSVREGSRAVSMRVDHPSGSSHSPVSRVQLEDKFRDCCDYAATAADADELLAWLWSVEKADTVVWPGAGPQR